MFFLFPAENISGFLKYYFLLFNWNIKKNFTTANRDAFSSISLSGLLPIINQRAFCNRDPSNSVQYHPRNADIPLNVLRKHQTMCHRIL